jgi:peptidyl-prolyl cis-trans isomerase D
MIRFLQQDNRITKFILVAFVAVVVIGMVIYLVPGIGDNPTTGNTAVYATVRSPGWLGRFAGDSKTIPTEQVQRMAEQELTQRGVPAQYVPMLLSSAMAQSGERLVVRAILVREADRLGLGVSDRDLKNELEYGPYASTFFPGGKFIGTEAYENLISSNAHMSVADFEADFKAGMELQRLEALVTGGVTVSDSAVRDAFRKDGTKVKFDYAVISSADVSKTINPSDTDLEAFFKQNAARYATAAPETRKLEFISFDASNLKDKPTVTDADVLAYYNAHPEKVADQVQTRHILISVPKGADAKTDAAAKAKAEDVLKQIRAGGNFGELAKKYSDDPGSKDKGGEYPMTPTTGFVPVYSQAAMALAPGATSEPVRSDFGYHLIQTLKKESAHTKTLAEVKDSISLALNQQRIGAAQQAFAQRLADQAKKDGMQKTADSNGLHLTTTDYVGKDGVIGSLADSAPLLTQAFSTAKGAAPAVVSTGEGMAVFQVDDVKPAHAPAFADIKSTVLNDYRSQKVPEILNSQLNKLAGRAQVLNDLKKAAAEMNMPLKTSDLVTQDSQVPDLGSMSGPGAPAFTLAKGAISAPINTGANGVLLQVTDKQEPTADEIAKAFSATREKLLGTQRQELFEVYAETLLNKYTKAGAVVSNQKKAPPSPLGN